MIAHRVRLVAVRRRPHQFTLVEIDPDDLAVRRLDDRGRLLLSFGHGVASSFALRVVGEALVELRVPVPDRPAVLAEVTTLAGSMGINIADIEIVHSVEGGGGILVLLVPASDVAAFEAALTGRGYHHSRRALP